jgi:hypothetical protein
MRNSRRQFLRRASVAAAAIVAGSGVETAKRGGGGTTLSARDSAPPQSKSATAMVPDSLDLVSYANYAINGMTQTLDPDFNYEIFFRVQLGTNPPYLEHDTTGLPTINPKYGESLPMMRVMTGSSQYVDIDQKLMQMMIDNTAEDGLYYSRYNERRTWHEGVGHNYNKQFHRDFANVYGNSRLLLAMMAWYQVDRDPVWAPRMEKLAHALCRISIPREDYSYYPDSQIGEAFSYAKGLGWLLTEEPFVEQTGAEGSMFMYHCGPIRALARYYALTGDSASLDMAARLVRYVMKPQFWGAEGEKPWGVASMVDPVHQEGGAEHGQWTGHPHAHIAMLRALLEFAYVTGNDSTKNFVRNAYEYTRSHVGIPRIGMFGEGCMNGDMPALSIMLSDAGLGDYWDDTDQYGRNHMVESMFTNPDLIRQVVALSPASHPDPPQDSSEDVIHRSIGVVGSPGMTCMHPSSIGCCTGNLTQAVYYVWESIVRHKDGNSQVNLLMNRASPWLDIDSCLPCEGKVVIKNKTSKRVSVRIPSWVDRSQLRCGVNGATVSAHWVGNFIMIENLKADDTLLLEFPIREATEHYTYAGRTYTLRFKGNTLVDISPRQDRGNYPIYQRDPLKQAKAPMKQVARFVAPSTIKWWSGVPGD